MSDLSITDLLFAYGAWVSDDNNELGCKSPSLMLIKSAPKLCKNSVKASKRRVVDFISDDEALAVDRAMNKLMRHSVHLHNIITYHFIYNWSVKQIADDYWSQFEYPCGKKKATNYHVNPLLNHAIGFINCELINDKACMF